MDRGRRASGFSIPANDSEGIGSFGSRIIDLVESGGGEPVPVAAASVNPPLFEKIEEAATRPIRLAGRDFPIPIKNRCRCPEKTGSDRLLDGFAAGHLHGKPVIAVDFGTALTFNLVGPEGDFHGGAILPGMGLAAHALGSGCARLPVVDFGVPPPFVGRDTEEAIASGLLNGYLNLVDGMVEGMMKEFGSPCATVATGGEAGLIVPRSRTIVAHDPDLTLRGIALAFERSGTE